MTLENAIYMSMKNDLACIIDCHLSLYEHQSTVNPNMPLRDLFYVAREYEKLLSGKTLYSSTLVRIPAPIFVTFYNGRDEQPEHVEMKLSDAFEMPIDNPALELRVIQLNVNAGYNEALMEKCPTLKEYSLYVARVRKYKETVPLREAVSVSIFEYDEEKEMKLIRQAEREAGREEGRNEGITAFIALCRKLNLSTEDTLSNLTSQFSISEETARKYLDKYLKNA